ncbi:syntaxin-8 [Musca vetustissima]|uniref:syntaxin-8 n=1 Tax=Musca vetustissima TaxID=27455 RepID=UPI002AB7B672|nr:syntaxin-8 [Musca vetustissima]
MALVDVDSWLTEYESCSRLNHTLLSQLNAREGKIHSSPDYNRLTLSIQVGIKQFDRDLQQLKYGLNEASKNKSITFEEIERRQRLLDTLQSERQTLQNKYTNSTRDDRSALLDSNWPSTSTTRAGDSNDDAAIIDVERLKQAQIDMIEQQNQGLETLSQTLARQRALATQLGQEVEDQNDILDNLANTIERVDTGVNRETRSISLINRSDSNTCGYWIVIIVLFVAIVIVALW